ncbi:hypothetical protein K525DRAFT_153750, partial [Schizophyllum commune Loenen D]
GTVTRLIPDNVLPEALKNTFLSLLDVIYSGNDRRWSNYPEPPLREHAAAHARETAQLLNAIANHCSLRFPDQRPPH